MSVSRSLLLAALLGSAASSPIGDDSRLSNLRRTPDQQPEPRQPQFLNPVGSVVFSSTGVETSLSVGASDSAFSTLAMSTPTNFNAGGGNIALPSGSAVSSVAAPTTLTPPPGPPKGPPGLSITTTSAAVANGPPALSKKTSTAAPALSTTLGSAVLQACTSTLSQTTPIYPCSALNGVGTIYTTTTTSTAYVDCGGCADVVIIPEMFFCPNVVVTTTTSMTTPMTQWVTACQPSTAAAASSTTAAAIAPPALEPPSLSKTGATSSVIVATSIDLSAPSTTLDEGILATSTGLSPPALTKASTASSVSVATSMDLSTAASTASGGIVENGATTGLDLSPPAITRASVTTTVSVAAAINLSSAAASAASSASASGIDESVLKQREPNAEANPQTNVFIIGQACATIYVVQPTQEAGLVLTKYKSVTTSTSLLPCNGCSLTVSTALVGPGQVGRYSQTVTSPLGTSTAYSCQ